MLLREAQTLLSEAGSPASWWYLALPAPHSHTPVDLTAHPRVRRSRCSVRRCC